MSLSSEFSWTSTSRTDVGMVRDHNEDACLDRPEAGLWVVADGMGGHAAGDVASGMIVESMSEVTGSGELSDVVEEVDDRLVDVNRRLRELAAKQETQTVGSTVAAFVIRGRYGVIMWAGDSRVYRIRDSRLIQASQDHALVEELVEKGVLTREQAATHPQGNLVTRAVGATDKLFVDVEILELKSGDVFVLCSDGLDKELKEEEIAEVVLRDNGGAALADVLVDLALSRGSRDNVTVVTVVVHAETEAAAGNESEGTLEADREQTLPAEEETKPSTRNSGRTEH